MKKTLLYIVIILSIVSCKKNPLDITPDGRITIKDVFKDEKLTEAFLNTAYKSIPQYFFSYGYYSMLTGSTDETQYYEGVNKQWTIGALTPATNPLNPFYANYWTGIRNANIFLDNIDAANVSNPVNRSRMKAEAKVLRAFYYLELIKQYGPMPIIDKDFDVAFDYTALKRPSFQENADFIVKDCNEAIANADLPIRITQEGERPRFSKAVAYAIKSQVLLYNASPLWNPNGDVNKWEAAALAGQTALTTLTAGKQYELAANYEEYFLSQADLANTPRDKETIYETGMPDRIHLVTMNNIPSKPGIDREGACPTQELVDSYDMKATGEPAITGYADQDHLQPIINAASGYNENDPYTGRDPRFYATIWYNGASYDNINGKIHTVQTFIGGTDQLVRVGVRGNTITGYYLRKFIDPKLQAQQNSNATWKKYRLGEIYLNFAEAKNEAAGPVNEVYEAINEIRKRAGMPNIPPGLNKDQMRERIRRERRVELAIEEHRFWDVRRWKILDKTDRVTTGMEITKGNNNTFTYKRGLYDSRNAWQSKFLIFPIPVTETSIIKDFNLNQNPGW